MSVSNRIEKINELDIVDDIDNVREYEDDVKNEKNLNFYSSHNRETMDT